MKKISIYFIILILCLSAVSFSFGITYESFSKLAQKDKEYNYLRSISKGNIFVAEVGSTEYNLDAALIQNHPELSSFYNDYSHGKWFVRFNKRNNKPQFLWGSGIRIFEKNSNISLSSLEKITRDFIAKHYDLFPILPENLVLDKLSGRVVKNPNKWFIRYFIAHNGIPLHRAFIFFRISHGNIIQIGMTGLEGWESLNTKPSLTKEEAIQKVVQYANLNKEYKIAKEASLKIIPTTENVLASANPPSKYEYRLVYELMIKYNGVKGSWLAWVDAHSGEVLLFIDRNFYEQKGSVLGGIFPISVDTNLDVVPGENCGGMPDIDQQIYLPFFDVALRGIPVISPISGIGGDFSYSGLGLPTCSLDGVYFDANDKWFLSDAEVYADANNELDIGTGGVDFFVSSIKQDPTTSATRNAYYHLNRARLLASQWLENVPWIYTNVPANVNINDTCNAYWDGYSVNFFASSYLVYGGTECNNTGQISSVMMHEWGHGLDDNAGGAAWEAASSEGHSDVMAFFNTHEDCLGPGFFTLNQCCLWPPCNDTNYAAYMANTACRAKGALRSAESYEDQYTYSPLVVDEDITTDNLLTRCRFLPPSIGPLGREVHCEGQVLPQAIWDIKKALQAEPQHLINGGWKYMEYLYFGAVDYGAEVYLTLLPDNYYDAMLAVDDDDGDLSNGTPHAPLIHDNYALHDLYTPASLPQSPHCNPPDEPILTSSIVSDGIQLNWNAVANADHYILYWVYDNPNGPAYLIYEGNNLTFTYKTKVPGTYYFAVQAIGTDGCPSTMEGVVSETIGAGLPDLKVSNVIISDNPPNGNGDGYGDVGETIELTIELTNQGNLSATNVIAKLNPLSAGPLILQGTSSYPDILPSTTATNSIPFKLYLTRALPCGSNVKFTLSISSNERLMEAPFEVAMGSMTNIYFKDFETPLGSEWIMENDGNTDAQFQYIPDATVAPWYAYPHSGTGVFGWSNDPISTNEDKGVIDTSSFWSNFPPKTFAALSFWHVFATEEYNDGGILEISTDNGNTWTDLGSKILSGAYNRTGCNFAEACWTKDNTYGNGLGWEMSEVVVDLSEYVGGNPPRIRWHAYANEDCDYIYCGTNYGADGWLIDDVAFKTCTLANRPYLTLIDKFIDDSLGNSNYGLDQGETVNLILTLKNESLTLGLTNVSATLISSDANVNIIDNAGSFGDIPADSTADNSADVFTISYLGPCKSELPFQLNINSDQGEFSIEFSITLGAGIVYIDDVESGQKPNISKTNGWKIYTDGPPYTTSGSNAWYVDNFSYYTEQYFDMTLDLPNNPYVELNFNQTFAFEDLYDGARLYISDDGGSTWTDLGPYMLTGGYNDLWYYDGEPMWTRSPYGWGDSSPPPPNPSWDYVSVDLSNWAGKNVIIEWWVFADGLADSCVEAGGSYTGMPCPSWPAPTWGDGLFIDDIKIKTAGCEYCALPEFTDTINNFAKYYIRRLQCSGVAGGCSATEFCPSSAVSREQMAKFVLKAAQTEPVSSCTGIFTDVPPTNIFCNYIEKLAETGIAAGCTASEYCPSNPILREQMAVFLLRSMGLPPASVCTGLFDDVPSSNAFCPYIEELANQGITGGCAPNLYCPYSSVQRDQMAKFLVQSFNL